MPSRTPASLPHGARRLTTEDYYRTREFRPWLAARDMYLDELSSADARRQFRRFVHEWNAGRLDGACGSATALTHRAVLCGDMRGAAHAASLGV